MSPRMTSVAASVLPDVVPNTTIRSPSFRSDTLIDVDLVMTVVSDTVAVEVPELVMPESGVRVIVTVDPSIDAIVPETNARPVSFPGVLPLPGTASGGT